MKYDPSGKLLVTLTIDHPGLFSTEGYTQVTDETGSGYVGHYAPDGSVNVVEGAGLGIYSPCGAWNVEFV